MKTYRRRLSSVLFGTTVLALGVAVYPHAAPAQTVTTVSSEPVQQLETIVVTARKRAENLQDTPIAITAFTNKTIEQQGLTRLSDLASLTPNLSFSPTANVSGSANAASVFIRGIGQTDFTLTTEPGVGIYLDGVYIGSSVGGVLDLVDIDHVEVLRGPQGTLFGKNTIGGAISVTTQTPGKSFGGQVEVDTGSYDRADAKFSVNLPINDKLFTKVSLATVNVDGYEKRIIAGDTLGGRNDLIGRFALRYLASDRLTFDLAASYTRDRDDSAPTTMLAVGNPAVSAVLGIYNASVPASQQYSYENFGTGNPYTTKGTGPDFSNLDLYDVAGTFNWAITDNISLKSISAYRHFSSDFGRDSDSSPILYNSTTDNYGEAQVSQEFQLTGRSFADRLKWAAGLFYFNETGHDTNLVYIPGAFGSAIGVPPGDNLGASSFTIVSGGGSATTSYAAYGQGTYAITNALSLTFGLRYTSEDKTFSPNQYVQEARDAGISYAAGPGLLLDPLISSQTVKTTTNQTSPKVSLEYKFDRNILGYVSYSTGFKGGGFDQRIFPGRFYGTYGTPTFQLATAPSYGPEKANVYEVGLKMTGFENRARLNLAAFHTDYDDIQVVLLSGIAPETSN
jgi:iron complex outermembrane receptor protein